MNRKVPDELKEKYPHYETYAKCQSSAFMGGTFAFATATASLYVVQELLKTRLPYNWSSFLLTSVLGGSMISYAYTRKKTKDCQDMWMAMEDRHTALTSADERKKWKPIKHTDINSVIPVLSRHFLSMMTHTRPHSCVTSYNTFTVNSS